MLSNTAIQSSELFQAKTLNKIAKFRRKTLGFLSQMERFHIYPFVFSFQIS